MSDDRHRHAARMLRVSERADSEEIRRAFRAAIREAHPDRGGSEQMVRELVEARGTLTASPRNAGRAAPTELRVRTFHRRRDLHRWWGRVVRRSQPDVKRRVI